MSRKKRLRHFITLHEGRYCGNGESKRRSYHVWCLMYGSSDLRFCKSHFTTFHVSIFIRLYKGNLLQDAECEHYIIARHAQSHNNIETSLHTRHLFPKTTELLPYTGTYDSVLAQFDQCGVTQALTPVSAPRAAPRAFPHTTIDTCPETFLIRMFGGKVADCTQHCSASATKFGHETERDTRCTVQAR
jgi:hypothetical protein